MNKILKPITSFMISCSILLSQGSVIASATNLQNSGENKNVNELNDSLKAQFSSFKPEEELKDYELVAQVPKYYKVVTSDESINRAENDENYELIEVSEKEFEKEKIEVEREKRERVVPGFEYPDVNGNANSHYMDSYIMLVTEVFRSLKDKNEFLNVVQYQWLRTPFFNLTDLFSTSVSNNMIIQSNNGREPKSETVYLLPNGQTGKSIQNTNKDWAPNKDGLAFRVPSPSMVYVGGTSMGYIRCYPRFTSTSNQDKKGSIVSTYQHYKLKIGNISWSGGIPSFGAVSNYKQYQTTVDLSSHKPF